MREAVLNKLQRTLSFFLVLAIVLSLMVSIQFASEADENLGWYFNEATGVMTIDGAAINEST